MSTFTGTLSDKKVVTTLTKVQAFTRGAIWALPVWAVMLFLGTLTHQPDPQTEFANFAAYVTTTQFLLSHLINSIGGAAIGSIGVIALMLYVQDTKAVGKAITGMVATVAGNALNSSVFGAAAFAQSAAGHAYFAGQQNAQDFYNLVYSAPLFATVIVALLLFIIGGIFTGIAITTSGRFPRWAGWVYTLTVVGFSLSFLVIPIAQSFASALLIITTIVIAWVASRKAQKEGDSKI